MTHDKEQLEKDLCALGIGSGDTVLMHSSYKSLGGIEGGAAAFFEAFMEVLGEEGTLILPSLTYATVTRECPDFDYEETPSCVGYLSEFFRTKVPGVIRSMHATHSCCVLGRLADVMVQGHDADITPVGENSPFAKLPKYHGKILMMGCGTRCNTSMHGVEETVKPMRFINQTMPICYTLKAGGQVTEKVSWRHHFFTESGARITQRYDRIVGLLNENEIRHGYLLSAESYLMDAAAVWEKGRRKMLEDPVYFVDYPTVEN